ncbi:hypothetical protein TWF281_006640 [Arthrobotrys megalospora]
MLYQYFAILLMLLGFAIPVPVPDGVFIAEEVQNLNVRQTEPPHQEYVINLDQNSQMLWMEITYAGAFDAFGKPPGTPKGLNAYKALTTVIGYMLNPPTNAWENGNVYRAPHGQCRVLYCNGENFGVSLCSKRKGEDVEVSLNGHSIGLIVMEWLEEFRWQRAEPRKKMDGDFRTPNFGRSYWSEDPSWSINFEECGNTFVDFEANVLHDV